MPVSSALLHVIPACELCAGPTLTDDEELDLWIYDHDPELYDGFVSPDTPRPEPGPDDPF